MTDKTGHPPIDRAVLEGIRMLEGPGGQGLLERVVTLYLSDSLKQMERIRSSAGTGDTESLRRAAHTLKSSSANVGAFGVSEICRKIEAETGAGAPPVVGGPLFGNLEDEYRSVRQELQAVLGAGRGEAAGE
ncbi:MAG: hybrid sensor histidine kinase/response regulator [Deltaproteobacteria bacterium]|nr:hybrid sensor histidine kinase/response regulator [Deltaproteobacteria bacterium]